MSNDTTWFALWVLTMLVMSLALWLSACIPAPQDFAPVEDAPPYVVVCDEADGGVLDCRWVQVIEV